MHGENGWGWQHRRAIKWRRYCRLTFVEKINKDFQNNNENQASHPLISGNVNVTSIIDNNNIISKNKNELLAIILDIKLYCKTK